MALMDPDGDGVISDAERKRYAERFVGDVTLTVDGQPTKLKIKSYLAQERTRDQSRDTR